MSEFSLGQSNQAPAVSSIGGFDFENVNRNEFIKESLAAKSKTGGVDIPYLAKKTGTTICGLIYKDGIVLGADTRATNDTEVVDKVNRKIMNISSNIYCCGAGTAADTDKICELIRSQLELQRLNTGPDATTRVVAAATLLKRRLFNYQGYISAALILGGCDFSGRYIYQIYPNGYSAKLPYTTMGSGSLAAISVFESAYVENMSETEAVELVKRAITAGIQNDLGSGSNVDLCVIRTDGTTKYERGAVKANEVEPIRSMIKRSERLDIKPGTTATLSDTFKPFANSRLTMADLEVTEMET